MTVRRTSMTNKKVDRISDLCEEYPHLKTSSLVMYEFQLLKNLPDDTVSKSIENVLEDLAIYYDQKLDSEESKANILDTLHKELTPKKFLNVNEQLFTITEGGKSSKELLSAEKASPRAVIYTLDKVIVSGYIVADGTIKMKVDDPTVSKVATCLIAAYYCWDVCYPTAFKNTLDFIDFKIFGTSINKRIVLEKFDRILNAKVSKVREESK